MVRKRAFFLGEDAADALDGSEDGGDEGEDGRVDGEGESEKEGERFAALLNKSYDGCKNIFEKHENLCTDIIQLVQ